MKHAGPDALKALESLLQELRKSLPAGIVERRPGTFYRQGEALLHFHEDPAGLFADLKAKGDWERYPVSDPAGRVRLIKAWKRQSTR
jgi:hypothetical protein